MQWLLKRNCSISPRWLLALFLALAALLMGIAGAFWWQGAPLVVPFAGLELAAVAASFLIYARHAADVERIVLQRNRLSVERTFGRRTERVEFSSDWVRVEPCTGDRSLIDISGEGKRVCVGRFVRPELRRALADELRGSLRAQRRKDNEYEG